VSWETHFPEHQVPAAVLAMVEKKYVRDTSDPFDPAPSFSAPLKGSRWLRLWVEHPSYQRRRAGPYRYHLEVTGSLKRQGRVWMESNDLPDVLPYMLLAIEQEGFRLAGIA